MNIRITLENLGGTQFILPYHYEEYIQAFLYRLNNPEFGGFLHDIGYTYNGRNYKLFAFSRILEKPEKIIRDKHMFVFPSSITFLVSSVENPMLEALMRSIYQFQKKMYIGKYEVTITALDIIPVIATSNLIVRTGSPICIYSTAFLPDGRKRTIYYSPDEKEFSELLRQNAIKKYLAYYQYEPEDDRLKVIPLGRKREIKSSYKGFVIRAYDGRFLLKGSEELIQIVLEAGLGGKNAEGKGMIFPEMM